MAIWESVHFTLVSSVLLMFFQSVSSRCINCRAAPYPQLDNYRSTKYTLWTKSGVSSVAECSGECARDVTCHSFIANTVSKTCTGYAGSFTTTQRTAATSDTGAKAYLMCTAPKRIGHLCYQNSDCIVQNSVCTSGACDCPSGTRFEADKNRCFALNMESCTGNSDCQPYNSVCHSDGYCRCDVGYSYDPPTVTCVQTCAAYGDTYTVWVDAGVDGCNVMDGVYSTSDACWQSCTDESRCRNVEFQPSTNTCHQCFTTWFDLASGRNDPPTDPGWTLAFRSCK